MSRLAGIANDCSHVVRFVDVLRLSFTSHRSLHTLVLSYLNGHTESFDTLYCTNSNSIINMIQPWPPCECLKKSICRPEISRETRNSVLLYRSRDKPYPPRIHAYRLLVPLKSMPPTTPAAIATPLKMATPIRPSLATLSSIKPLRLAACKLAGSWSSKRSLYLLASA